MRKLEQIQLTKLISAYGGVGSIIETNTNGSLIILPYDKWNCYENMQHNNEQINDQRLLGYLQHTGYDHLQRLVPIPTPNLRERIHCANDRDTDSTIKSQYFPEWYFCTNHECRRLKRLSQWERDWKESFNNDDSFNRNSPACNHCSTRNGTRFHRQYLQQVRFVMASLPTGEVKDVPFDQLWNHSPQNGAWLTQRQQNVQLTYRTLPNGDGLNAIYIYNGDRPIFLSEIERNYIIYRDQAFKMVVKSSSSLYLPNIVSSLYIPNVTYNEGDIYELQEFRYLTSDNNFINYMIVDVDLVAKRIPDLYNKTPFVSRITAIERLKETSVLHSYSRMGTPNELREWYNVQEGRINNTMRAVSKMPFDNNPNLTTWMPAIEAYGEGILFEINVEDIQRERVEEFIHTFCHIIMKEMEFQCGYPLTSLREKIYNDLDNNTAGFIIYTIAGTEGSYGGLISLTKDDKIIRLIERGTERAKNCPNDPICISEQAHCFACMDIPETSCTRFNTLLNRKDFIQIYHTNNQRSRTQNNVQNNDNIQPDIEGRPDNMIL